MSTAIWIVLIIMSPFILVALLLFVMGMAALAGAVIVAALEVWSSWRERRAAAKGAR